MAGDWIKMRVDLADDPHVIAIAAQLQVHETHVVGMLHKAWSWADKHAKNGHAKNVTLSWIDRFIGVTGFGQAMQEAGWLVVEDGITFPDFDRHNGESAKKRADDTDRKRKERSSKSDVNSSGNVSQKSPEFIRKVSHKNSDKSVTREEKRREELTSKAMSGDAGRIGSDSQNLNGQKLNAAAVRILEYLNSTCGTKFEPVKTHITLIKARLSEYPEETLMRVIDAKRKQWKGTESGMYLRPATLFNAEKCGNYVGQLDIKVFDAKPGPAKCCEPGCEADGTAPVLGKLYCPDHFYKHNDAAQSATRNRNPVEELAGSVVKPV